MQESTHGFIAEPEQDLFEMLSGPRPTIATTAEVVEASADVAVVRLADGRMASLPITEFYPNKRWTVGARYQVAILDNTATRPIVSATCPELVGLIAAGYCPEIRDGSVRIIRCVRSVGIRAKIAVVPTVAGVDAVGALVGRAANRVQAISRALAGERVDVVAYSEDADALLRNALGVKVDSITDNGRITSVSVPAHQFDAAIGGGGLNASLAARLTGRRISVSATSDVAPELPETK